MTPQILGIAFHSALIAHNLILPKNYNVVYIDHRWGSVTDLKKNLAMDINKLDSRKPTAIFAGSLAVLKMFLNEFPEINNLKIVLCEYPGLISPKPLDPIIKWLDCDHQAGGAWQTATIKPESLEDQLSEMDFLNSVGKEFVNSLERSIPRDRVSEIELVTEQLSANDIKTYKNLISDISSTTDVAITKELKWKTNSLKPLLLDLLANSKLVAHQKNILVGTCMDYILAQISKREFASKLNKLVNKDEVLKKKINNIRKWIDEPSKGGALKDSYFKFLFNADCKPWDTFIGDTVNEEDLVLIISVYPYSEMSQITFNAQKDAYREEVLDSTVNCLDSVPEIFSINELLEF